ncbi:MAG: flagellin N-terminal helical domain-containing protein [Planctomycetota bacterium]|jgi:flagellin
MLAIKNNVMAGNAARHLGKAYDSLSTSVERLSSGLRINSAKDDAAGLAVRELVRADIAVLQQGSRNAQDGISMLQTMEGAMGVIDDNLIRMKELAEQAATGSYSNAQRQIMNAEFDEMANEIERIALNTKFNDIAMLNGDAGDVKIHVGTASTIDVDKVDLTKTGLGIDTGTGSAQYVATAAGVADSTAAFVTGAGTFDITFGAEAQIVTAALAIGDSMDDVADAINAASRAASDYNAAEVTYDETTEQYNLKISAKEGGVAAATIVDGTGVLAAGDVLEVTGAAGGTVNILTATDAANALGTVTTAIEDKDTARAAFGYKMNRLESTISIVDIQAENLQAAESRISDVDVATEMATMTRTQVLAQAGISMLSQANQMPQMAMSLLR